MCLQYSDMILSAEVFTENKINQILENETHFRFFCYKCLKLIGEDFDKLDLKLKENQLILLIISKYFFISS